ncbi:MAG: tRNA (adenosine(37)-N6)-threonylcarbamoyltransferase complex dimerization subunit type 1 TsaB [Chloroflexi bacterium]|nr:tRNA (adenosine(37)-N6)-threonylcarbamoyltransferase complex dimerization subunit type 1 TsaB [Chloroflexota bacterium]
MSTRVTGAAGLLLAMDTATRCATVAIGDGRGEPVAERTWQAGHGHAASLLPAIEAMLREAGAEMRELDGIVVGIGPGAFTGLRVGLATAKVLAYALGRPIVGVSTAEALAWAVVRGDVRAGAAEAPRDGEPVELAILLPAGVSDHYLSRVRIGPEDELSADMPPQLLSAGDSALELAGDTQLVAVDLSGRGHPAEAVALGARAQSGLGRACLRIGARALAVGRTDDVAELVPAYVALPRGVQRAAEAMAWSPDLR